MIVIGVILATHFSLWITSLKMTSVASSVILVTAHPVLVAPVSFYFLKEKLSWVNALGIAISLGWCRSAGHWKLRICCFWFRHNRRKHPCLTRRDCCWVVYFRRTNTQENRFDRVLCLRGLRGWYDHLVFHLSHHSVPQCINLTITDYEIILLMALVSGIFGHTLYNWSLGYIRASVMSVALLGEPIGSSLLAYAIPWIHQEPSLYTVVGGGIILVGIYLTARTMKDADFLENV